MAEPYYQDDHEGAGVIGYGHRPFTLDDSDTTVCEMCLLRWPCPFEQGARAEALRRGGVIPAQPEPYYADARVIIYQGDALDVLPWIESATCVALDPPYSMIPNAFAGQDDGAAGSSAAPVRLLTETLRETRRLLSDGGAAGLICDWRRLPDVSYLATLVGLRISTCLAWTRSTPGMGGMFRSAWDPMLVLSVGTPNIRDKAAARNVIHAEKPRGGEHPYEKPVALWQYLFDRLPVGVVVDPFAGTGASGVAAIAAGHRWIGIEIEERYCEIAATRCSQEVLGLAI